jgi:hypothetical protein
MDQNSQSIVKSVAASLNANNSRAARNDNNVLGATGNQDSLKRSLHDLEAYKIKKMEESSPFFRTTRVQTCSHVMMRNGKAIAVAFPLEKTGWKNPSSYGNVKRSSEVESWSK